jgi:hypothetical protein
LASVTSVVRPCGKGQVLTFNITAGLKWPERERVGILIVKNLTLFGHLLTLLAIPENIRTVVPAVQHMITGSRKFQPQVSRHGATMQTRKLDGTLNVKT